MTTVIEMKQNVLKIMSETYKKVAYEEIENRNIEAKGFLLEEHAKSIREACKNYNLQVSFRGAGTDTLNCIKKGNPCKGHTILDKSIKEKEGNWTYSCLKNGILEKYKGLVGYSKTFPILAGIWKLSNGKPIKTDLESAEKVDKTLFFTGDYDMHDLLKEGKRVLSNTPEEASTIHNLLVIMDKGGLHIKEKEKFEGRWFNSPYAWIRHGAQTSYISYLLSGYNSTELKERLNYEIDKLPLQGKVTTIDDNIVMFDQQEKAYLLDSRDKIYQYYKDKNLLEQIPFYFFFDDLIKKNEAKKEIIENYAKELYSYLKKTVNT